uniref:restriction endonuclease subunit S n=1 Tax=Listeria costaricensis TaxID=2026604 RepID=UPI0013C426DA
WEQRKLGDFYFFKNGLNKEKRFFGEGTPIVNFTDVFHNREISADKLKGKVTLSNSEIKRYEVKQGDLFFTRTSETIDEIGYPAVMMDALDKTVFSGFVLRGRALDIDPLVNEFKKYVFFTTNFRQEVVKKSSMTTRALTTGTALSEMFFRFPINKDEQKKIGVFLTSIDETITLHQRKLDLLKQLKQGFLQQLFPQKEEKVPRVRFANFEGEWEQRKAKELFHVVTEKGHPELPLLSITQDNGVVYREKLDIDIKYDLATLKNYKVIHPEDFIISLRSFQGGFELSDKLGITSPAYTIFAHKKINQHNNLFWKTQFKTFKFIESLKVVTFGIRDGKSISFSQFGGLNLIYPPIAEQTNIGLVFKQIDYIIILQQKKLQRLKGIKQGYLKKMFL